MNVDPNSVIPLHMQRLIAETEARDANEEHLRELARQDEAASHAIMRTHSEHVHEALTGHSAAELLAARQANETAKAEAGWDPSAPLGTEAHPELLIDGSSLTPNSAQAAAAQATRYATVSGIDAQLSRNAAEAAAWNSPVIRRVRMAALEAEISRGQPGAEAAHHARYEIARQAELPAQWYPEIRPRLAAGDW